ncbi:hypothetical protein [Aneurinibacillus sp. REN35]|uniref:hypothetical protein n=1 Tax=Aneurinibacillus sp. REN35 TaxID=3237286 RepID=UPI0035286678
MHLFIWIFLIFAAHLLMYYALGTPAWIATSLLATLVWAVVLIVAQALWKQRQKSGT